MAYLVGKKYYRSETWQPINPFAGQKISCAACARDKPVDAIEKKCLGLGPSKLAARQRIGAEHRVPRRRIWNDLPIDAAHY